MVLRESRVLLFFPAYLCLGVCATRLLLGSRNLPTAILALLLMMIFTLFACPFGHEPIFGVPICGSE